MIISDSHHIIFLHNPKCAGTTVRETLKAWDTRGNFYWGAHDVDGKKVDKAHLPLDVLHKLWPQDHALVGDHFTFGFVRDPYRRTISAFNEVNQNLHHHWTQGRVADDEYRRVLNAYLSYLSPGAISGWYFPYRHFVPQHSIFMQGDDSRAHVILKVEDGPNEWAKALRPRAPQLADLATQWAAVPKNTRQVDLSTSELLTSTTIRWLNALYAEDFEHFNYPML